MPSANVPLKAKSESKSGGTNTVANAWRKSCSLCSKAQRLASSSPRRGHPETGSTCSISTVPNSEEGLSSLWSRILMGELESPGSVPKKLMRILETLTREEAETFMSICRFTASVVETPRLMVFTEPEFMEVFTPPNHLARTDLEAAGLIRHTQNEFTAVHGKLIVAHYYGSEAARVSQVELGDWHFTKEGSALYRVARSSIMPDEQFRSWFLNEWPLIGPGRVKDE